jgi:Tol biopolymer transport system component
VRAGRSPAVALVLGAAGAVLFLAAAPPAPAVGAAKAPGPSAPARVAAAPMVVAQVPAGALAGEALGGGSLRAEGLGEGGRLALVSPAGVPRVLTADFASAADPEVSFDGKSILFAGKKTVADPWCVWEMKADGTGARQVTCGEAGARQPVYQSTIYTITPKSVEGWVQVAFVGENKGERNEAGVAANTSLWSCKTDGSALRRLTYSLSNDLDPVVLPDGRMVYAGWLRSSAKGGPNGRVPLLGVNEDGTDYQVYADHEGLRVKQMPTPTAKGLVVFVEADTIAGDGSGRLAAVEQVRPLHSYRSLTDASDGFFRAPAPLPDGRVLVAWRASREGRFGIYRLDPATGAREKAFEDPAWHSVAAKLVAPRPVPDARSSVVREDDKLGTLYTLDVSLQAAGEELVKGAARTLRVVEGVPASAERPAAKRLLGDVPLAEDGSYQVQIPANTPVQLQLLDADGRALRTSTWLWVRNHDAQGCLGCHEDPERTPPNRFIKALSAPAPVLNPPLEQRQPLADHAGDSGRPSAEAVQAFVSSIGGQR